MPAWRRWSSRGHCWRIPSIRPRKHVFAAMLDVLIRASQVSQAEAVLTGLGMRIGCQSTSSPPPPQAQWVFVDAPTDFALDLHWALSNHQGLRGCLRFDELAAEAQPLPGLAPPARGLGRVHALLHACIHYYGHHRNQFKPLQWLLDMDLLWRAMSDQEQARLVDLSLEKGIAGLVAASLTLAVAHFGTPIDAAMLARLDAAGRRQRTTRLLKATRFRILGILEQAAWVPGVRGKLATLRAMLFPPAAIMAVKYPEGSRFGLPGMWVRRFVDALRPRR
ncbi:MAG: hypothetical protein EA400_04535 [Chromatiaceae bacterium]|nr:MAG: hypothetical protein EA400_04535 [Chromatiaceae bacterium]